MHLSPDERIFCTFGPINLNATIVFTWAIMLLLISLSFFITRRLVIDRQISRWQSILEIIVKGIEGQISEIGPQNPQKYIPFLGTLFLYIATANILTIVPWYEPPTGSLSTTVALAACVFVSVPFFAISATGVRSYLKTYLEPTFVMLPFNIIGEVSRTLALAVRLFGNMMSGSMILAILLSVTPLIFPIAITVLGLLTGMVQAYIFSVLAAVYIASALSENQTTPNQEKQNG